MKLSTMVEETRGNVVENIHKISVCVVDEKSNVVYSTGNEENIFFFRSASKPLQTIPVLLRHLDEAYQLEDAEIAIMAGSHRGEPFHVEVLQGLLDKTRIDPNSLICPKTYPINEAEKQKLMEQGVEKKEIFHCCYGKHIGTQMVCRDIGADMETYFKIENPVQKMIQECIAVLSEYPAEQIQLGIDGCGVPVFALPLRNMAVSYMKLACPDTIQDQELRSAVEKLTRCVHENHDMISGTENICSILNSDPNLVGKSGAQGVYCIGIKNMRLGIAVKFEDGSRVEESFIAKFLAFLGYDNQETIDRLYQNGNSQIKNDRGDIIGERISVIRQVDINDLRGEIKERNV